MVLTALPLTGIDAFAESDFVSGQCGDNVYYYFNGSTRELTIGGSGSMYNYTFGSDGNNSRPSPFYDSRIRLKECNVVIEDGVTSIGENAFCSVDVHDVTLPDSVTVIEEFAFSNSEIGTLTLGTGVTRIKQSAFAADGSMTVSYPGTQAQWDAVDIAFIGNEPLLYIKPQLKTYTGDTSNSSIHYSFNAVTGELVLSGSGAMYYYDDTFRYNRLIKSVVVGSGITLLGIQLFVGCQNLTSVSLSNTVKTISDGTFSECEKLSSVNLPDSLEYIGTEAFMGCAGLTELYIPGSVTEISWRAFNGCISLENVYFSEGIQTIDYSAFANTGVTSVNLPNSLEELGVFAFCDCLALKSVMIPGGISAYASFSGCNAIERLYCYASLYCDNYFRTHGYSSEICYYGDVDLDGALTVNDIGAIMSYSTGNTVLNDDVIRIVADFNRDGAVDGFDAARVDRVVM